MPDILTNKWIILFKKDADQGDINSIGEKKLSLINGIHINFQDKNARTHPSQNNSITAVSTNRSNLAASIYETAANSIDYNIRDNFKGPSSSEFYSAIAHSVVEVDPINDVYCDPSRRPLLNHQNSILAVKPTVWRTYDNSNSTMQVINKIQRTNKPLDFILIPVPKACNSIYL